MSNAAFASVLVDALHRLGVRHACITPGSRSTPLALALADSPIEDWSHHDERSSAFFALGIARTLGEPVAIVTTSGTAAAELHPALAEAREARASLIALTADRPLELRNVGAPQTIDQENLYGPSVKWAADIPASDSAWSQPARLAALTARLVAEATTPPAGPVHLNVRFAEPLLEEPVAPAPSRMPQLEPGRLEPDTDRISKLAARLAGRRGLLIAGPTDDFEVAASAAAFAASSGWPILADPLSGLRAGGHDLSNVLTAFDALGWDGYFDRNQPEVIVRFGAIPTSKPAWMWLGAHPEVEQVFIEPAGRRDPTGTASTVLRAEPAAALDLLAKATETPADEHWLHEWRTADLAAAAAVDGWLEEAEFPNEPAIARTSVESTPAGSNIWVASSMPIRDVDAVMRPTPARLRVMANRGANGIDGFISTALGSAAASGNGTVALAGDLSMLHDIGSLATAARIGPPLKIVVVNNDGGGIFHLLPQEGHRHFERHFGTPHGLRFAPVAEALGVPAEAVVDRSRLSELIASPTEGPLLVELSTNRARNADHHREIRSAVAEALAGL